MPYKIKKVKNGYKVCKKDGGKCFSKKPLSKGKAKAQMSAIQINEKKSRFDNLCEDILNNYVPL